MSVGVVAVDDDIGTKYVPLPKLIASRVLPLRAARFRGLFGARASFSAGSFDARSASSPSGHRESTWEPEESVDERLVFPAPFDCGGC